MKTKLVTIKFKNFLSSGKQGIEYDFSDDKSITLIHGENGTGKSIFLDALFYGLLGKPFRNVKLADLPNRLNNDTMLVELTIQKGADTFLIKRGMKPKLFEIIKNKKEIDETNPTTLQAYMEKYILEGSKNILSQFIINDKFQNFMKLSKWQKRSFLEEIINYLVVFSEMNRLINFKKTDVDKNLQKYQIKQKVEEKSLEHLLSEKNKSSEEIKNSILELKNKLIDIKNSISDIDDLTKTGDELDVKIKKIDSMERTLYNKKEDIKRLIKKYNDAEKEDRNRIVCPHCEKLIDLFEYLEKFNIEDLSESLNKVISNLEKTKNAKEKLETKNKSLTKELRGKISLRNKAQVYKEEYDKLRNKKANTLDNLDEKIEKLEKLIKEITAEKNKLVKKYRHYEIIQSDLISDDGLRKIIIRNIVPYINSKVQHYLNLFNFNSVKLKFNSDFDGIMSVRGEEISYGSLSAGESSRVDMAILFAFLNFIQMKSIFNLNLVVFDEICRNLDYENTERFLNTLKHDPLFAGKNIIVISHKEVPFSHFTKVVKTSKTPMFTTYKTLQLEEENI